MPEDNAPLLPPALKIESGETLSGFPAVKISARLHGSNDVLSIVLTPSQVRAIVPVLANQEDRRIRALAALMLRQARAVDDYRGPHLRLAGGTDA